MPQSNTAEEEKYSPPIGPRQKSGPVMVECWAKLGRSPDDPQWAAVSKACVAETNSHEDGAGGRARDLCEETSKPTVPQNIVWIASYPKSGNTWVRVFLHNLLREMRGETDGSQDINKLGRFTSWEIGPRHFYRVAGKPTNELTYEEIAGFRPRVQAALAASQRGPALVKTHLCFGTDYGFPTINLAATRAVIYIARNPLDVAISFAHHSNWDLHTTIVNMGTPAFRTPNFERSAGETIGSWSQNVASWIGLVSRPVLIVRYEEFHASPLKTFGSLSKYLGINANETQLRAAIAKSSFHEMRRQEDQNGFRERPPGVTRFFRSGSVGEWRSLLSSDEVSTIIRSHGPMMQRLGYMSPNSGSVSWDL